MKVNQVALGVAITCVAFFSYTVMDGILKWLGSRMPVAEQFAGTAFVSALILFMIGTKVGTRIALLRTGNLKLHCLRGLLFLSFGDFSQGDGGLVQLDRNLGRLWRGAGRCAAQS